MKLFPFRIYNAEILLNGNEALEKLRQVTKQTDSLSSEYTDKAFIGEVKQNSFNVISSVVGIGAICVLSGNFHDNKGTICLKVHPAFKIMFFILLLLPITGFIVSAFLNGFSNSIGVLVPTIIGLLFIKFILIESSFHVSASIGMTRLKEVIQFSSIERDEQ